MVSNSLVVITFAQTYFRCFRQATLSSSLASIQYSSVVATLLTVSTGLPLRQTPFHYVVDFRVVDSILVHFVRVKFKYTTTTTC